MTTATNLDFAVETTSRNPGLNLPQRMGRTLWAPMWVMAVLGFTAGIIAAAVRTGSVVDGASAATLQAQSHLVSGLMFVGFAGVFASIGFAVTRILGVFRTGGGQVQETLGVSVETLKMPATAKIFMATMMMAMMALFVAVIVHFVIAASTAGAATSVADSESIAIVLEAVRRLGVALYLVAIAFGLATITKVLRHQAIRLRELPGLVSNT